jgi:hypothetical protein
VFCFRSNLVAGALLSIAAGTLCVSFVVRDPLRELFAHGQVTTDELADLGCLGAALACLAGAGIAFVGAWDEFWDERRWVSSIGSAR